MPNERDNPIAGFPTQVAASASATDFRAPMRIPPQNIDAEMSVLGSLMLDKDGMYKVVDVLSPQGFYRDQHYIIFASMLELFEAREPIDVLSVSNRMREKGTLEHAGGVSYLTTLVNSVPTASNIVYYADIMQKKYILRSLIGVSHEINQLGYKE